MSLVHSAIRAPRYLKVSKISTCCSYLIYSYLLQFLIVYKDIMFIFTCCRNFCFVYVDHHIVLIADCVKVVNQYL